MSTFIAESQPGRQSAAGPTYLGVRSVISEVKGDLTMLLANLDRAPREAAMRYSINIPNLGEFADPRVVGEVARLAEEAGWDGLFVWDQLIGYNRDLVAEFAPTNLLLTAAALATNRIRLGTQVTPVPRRRPQQLAREIATLDQP